MPQFASALFENAQQTDEILDAIEDHLRHGETDLAADLVAMALDALEDQGHPIAGFCHAVPVSSVELLGWEAIAERLWSQAQAGCEVSAISIDLSRTEEPEPDQFGHFEPLVETRYYSDASFQFSSASRATLNSAYSDQGSAWLGRFDHSDTTITIRGMDELNAAIEQLHSECADNDNADSLDHDAFLIGSAFLAVRLHQAVKAKIIADGLPRRMAVLVGSEGVFPHFEAVVFTRDECPKVVPQLEAVPAVEAPVLVQGSAAEPRSENIGPANELRRRLLSQSVSESVEAAKAAAPDKKERKPVAQSFGRLKSMFSRR
jgi:hypothetical protein